MSASLKTEYKPGNAQRIEALARIMCNDSFRDPDALEPGNVILYPTDDLEKWESAEGVFIDALCDSGVRPPDGYNRRGEACHKVWREYIDPAQRLDKALPAILAID